MDARALVQAVWRAGTTRGLRAVRGPWWRRTDRAQGGGAVRARVPGMVEEVEPGPGGGVVRFSRSVLRVRVAVGGAVFLGWDGAEVEPSYAVADGGPSPVDARVALEPDTAGGWRVVSERVSVVVARHGAVEIRTPGGLLLRRDQPPRWWERADGADDGHWTQRSELTADADVFGLGGRAAGPRLEEGRYRLWHIGERVADGDGRHSPVSLPVQLVVADAGSHLVFHDSGRDGELTLRRGRVGDGSGHDRPGRCLLRMDGGAVRYWVLPGPPDRALRGWAALTGAPAEPPAWALGYQHAAERGDADALAGLVAACRERGVPLRGLHLGPKDGASGEQTGTGGELGPEGVEVVRGVDPQVPVRPGEEWYECGRAAEVFLRESGPRAEPLTVAAPGGGRAVLPDFTDAGARKWWGRSYLPLVARGASGLWQRPYGVLVPTSPGRARLPLSARHALEGRGGDLREAHNVLPLAMARATYEGCRESGTAGWLFSGGAWAGVQRYGGVVARVSDDWAGIRAAVSVVVGLGLCGVPFAGVDVAARPSGELGQRWFQLGAWLPLFRTRGGAVPPQWPQDPEQAAGLAAAADGRERLLPYLVTLARVAAESGAPLVRPPWWQTPSDRALRAADEAAFLLGDAFLVAPVWEPGIRRRRVRLPRGSWYDVATGEVFHGGRTVTVEAPPTRLPVLVRAGAVVPVAEPEGRVVLEVWAPPAGRTGGGVYAPRAGAALRRYAVGVRGGRPVVTREDGEAPEFPVRVRGRGA